MGARQSLDLDLISDDVWKRKRAPTSKFRQAKGVAPKAPPMTVEAKQAIREIQSHIFGIDGKMEFLTEPALKGFAFEVRRLAENDLDNAVWRGIAEAADRRREILARYRTGSGVWYASVDVIRWILLGTLEGPTASYMSDAIQRRKPKKRLAAKTTAQQDCACNEITTRFFLQWPIMEPVAFKESYMKYAFAAAAIAAMFAAGPVHLGLNARQARRRRCGRPAGIARLVRMNRPIDPEL
jgi:hypothetical protein